MRGTRRTAGLGLMAVMLAAVAEAQECTVDRATGTTIDARPFREHTTGTRWNFATDRLAATEPGSDGYYRVITFSPDSRDAREILQGRPGVPQKHQGSPYWQPSGRYLLFTAEKETWHGTRLFGSPDYEALPGFGRHDDLWLATADGSRSWRLTDEPDTKDEGVLIPVFSPDGLKVAWASRQPGGAYVLKVAEFREQPAPHLESVREYAPGGRAYYETGSFTSDGRSLVYTSDQVANHGETKSFWKSQIYRLNLATGQSVRLTRGEDYNEHPTVVKTAGGDWVVYMTTHGAKRQALSVALGTDWFAMRLDGSGVKRLTEMNTASGNPENTGRLMVAGTVAVSPGGGYMLGDVQDSLLRQTGFVKVVRFTCE